MPRAKDLKRDAQIRELRKQGLTMREFAQQLGTSTATVPRTLGPAIAPDQLAQARIEALEARIRVLEEKTAMSKDFSQVAAKMSGFLRFTFRDQLTEILQRWPWPASPSHAVPGRTANGLVVLVVPRRSYRR
jgi:DNA-binding transcriptional MerR regulator